MLLQHHIYITTDKLSRLISRTPNITQKVSPEKRFWLGGGEKGGKGLKEGGTEILHHFLKGSRPSRRLLFDI